MADDALPPHLEILSRHAEEFRRELEPSERRDALVVAVEAGYLAGAADGEVDATERATIAQAVEMLSDGEIIEWELESLLDACVQRSLAEGPDGRARSVGAALALLGRPEVGLFFATLVAFATGGIDASERRVLEAIAAAAGVGAEGLDPIIARVTSLG
jgi:tellurite resistance protein